MMKRLATRLKGPILLEPVVHRDARGFFVETFRADQTRALGITDAFVQENHSRSSPGILRGLHFQGPPGQAKLVRCVRGEIFDVVVDIRQGSSTFGQWESFCLDDRRHLQLYVPVGFAHGFMAMTEADVTYRVSTYYEPTAEFGIAWNDPDIAIGWPIRRFLVSDRDDKNPTLRELDERLIRW
jgi:dTDP-4-dehydrorhamnose 3,5-epimerase